MSITCRCGAVIKPSSMYQHESSQKHIRALLKKGRYVYGIKIIGNKYKSWLHRIRVQMYQNKKHYKRVYYFNNYEDPDDCFRDAVKFYYYILRREIT